MKGKQLALGLLGALVLAGISSAQKLKVTPEGLRAGGQASIQMTAPGQAGKTILIEIDNGGVVNPKFDYVTVKLDKHGNGSAKWNVPEGGWNQANFNAPECAVVSMLVKTIRDPTPPRPNRPPGKPAVGPAGETERIG